MNKAKLYKLINTGLGLLLGFAALFFLVWLFRAHWSSLHPAELLQALKQNPQFLLFALLLFPINWGLELLKWKGLVSEVQSISLSASIGSILAGIFASLITPNRIGELAGRLAYIESKNRAKVLYFNTLCASSQLLVTAFFGLIALRISWLYFFSIPFLEIGLVNAITIALLIALIYLFLRSNLLYRMSLWISKSRDKMDASHQVSLQKRMILLGLSCLRYVVFCLQFYLLFSLFETGLSFIECSAGLGVLFLFTALVPTGWISDLPVRTSLAFFVFEQISGFGFAGLFASVLLWSINLALPSLLALVFLRNLDWFQIPKFSKPWM